MFVFKFFINNRGSKKYSNASKTKATLENCLLADKSEFGISDLTKSVLNQMIERIVIKDERTTRCTVNPD
ncbi:hypothetical protein [Ruminiclostridium papyrosolvens]|uniref:Uncharacterized protein n=1 Tax=Ruminiclostridium papyrosolvens C7 TaxID=1330534 RepID=U4R776_9FIRM|nr:hypothetical protein [Ruminiclostridium papyrosolvens]EPR14042.1 hypothetical protein L323_01460 [Ruminiclostridium papyrosolvens C7]